MAQEITPKNKKGGRPKKNDGRDISVRFTVTETFKKKLGIICNVKGKTENDYIYEALKKVVDKDYEQVLSAQYLDFLREKEK